MQDLIARLRAGTVTPDDLDAAAEALENMRNGCRKLRRSIAPFVKGMDVYRETGFPVCASRDLEFSHFVNAERAFNETRECVR